MARLVESALHGLHTQQILQNALLLQAAEIVVEAGDSRHQEVTAVGHVLAEQIHFLFRDNRRAGEIHEGILAQSLQGSLSSSPTITPIGMCDWTKARCTPQMEPWYLSGVSRPYQSRLRLE